MGGWIEARARKLREFVAASLTAYRVRRSVPSGEGAPHGLRAPLIVSLTSYPPRFPTLSLTLRSLLSQSVRADRTLLWVTRADANALPADVLELQRYGLELRLTNELGPYKKIIPALEAHPDAFIATADDDNYYPPDWLSTLVEGQRERPGSIVCHTARVMQFGADGALLPYRSWPRAQSADEGPLLPTGYGGVLYPPGSLPPETTDRAMFGALSPTADDLWLKWMSARHGSAVLLVRRGAPSFEWPGSQREKLVRVNIHQGGNDRQIRLLSERLGVDRFRNND